MNWYAAQTRYRHERLITQACTREGIESFVPWVEEKRNWNGERAVVVLPLIGGFVFVRQEPSEAVVRMPGFIRWIMFNHEHGVVTEEEIQTMRTACMPEFRAKPEKEFLPGQGVIVGKGPFEGRKGTVVSQDRGFVRIRFEVGGIVGFSVQVPIEDVG